MINDSKDFTDRNQNMTMGYYSRHGHLIVHVSLGWLRIMVTYFLVTKPKAFS